MSVGRAAAAALACAVLAGCVSAGQYEKALRERDAASERSEQLAASVEALSAERDRVAGELEDARLAGESVTRDAERLRGDCEAQLSERSAKLDQLHATYEGLVRDLEAQLASGNSQIEQLREGLRTSLPAEVLFGSGSADLTEEGEEVLADLAKNLRRDAYAGYQILVEGHTDAVAVRGALAQRFATNWELAGARAARVVRALEESGVDASRLSAVSRGAQQPIATNDTAEGRAANRRIEIRLVPSPGTPPAPAPAEAQTPPPADAAAQR